MHPQAIIVDGSTTEEAVFLKSMREQTGTLKSAFIEIPEHGVDGLAWLTKLDCGSLAGKATPIPKYLAPFRRRILSFVPQAWNKISIDILIHALPGASGSLIRLLKSLSSADFSSGSVPRLTIELPHDIDPPTEAFLQSFQWPPAHLENPSHLRLLSLRHRIPRHGVSEEESSVRFLENFWPINAHSHALVLSPQAELSPNFFNCKRQ